ncbi:MAG: GspE/PulE family protein [Enterovibrio sp.]
MDFNKNAQNTPLPNDSADFDKPREAQLENAPLNSAQSLSLAHLLVDLDKKALSTDAPLSEPTHTAGSQQYIDLQVTPIDLAATRLLNETVARYFNALPIKLFNNVVTVAMLNPQDLGAQAQIMAKLQPYHCHFVAVEKAPLLDAFARYYRKSHDLSDFVSKLESEHQAPQELQTLALSTNEADDATVVRLIRTLLEDALFMRASDIHIEPDADCLRIRLRVDGVLQENVLKTQSIANALILRIKIMSKLDIMEKRLPQDGRFSVEVKGTTLDVRVSTLPVVHGEALVMRLLNQETGILSLDELGIEPTLLARLRTQLQSPHGMVLVTGPTGSGKTTTLYAALNELNVPGKKILTAEDPVEYQLARINQLQIHPKIGLTFAAALRSFLRQDPDIILLGEMRDEESVEMGIRAALTGHLLLSTLHTNNAIDSILRLFDLGAPGFLISATVRSIIAQRLVRRICPHCAASHSLSPNEHAWLKKYAPDLRLANFVQATGCLQCGFTGYLGRVGLFEMLELTPELTAALRVSDKTAFVKEAQQQMQGQTMLDNALKMAVAGTTTLAELQYLAQSVAHS